MKETVKARLRESRLLAPSGRGGGSPRNLAFAFSCMSVYANLLNTRPKIALKGHIGTLKYLLYHIFGFYRVTHLVANLGWVDLDLGSSHGWWPLL